MADHNYRAEEIPNGRIFHLRNGVRLQIQRVPTSDVDVMAHLRQERDGKTIAKAAPDIGNMFRSSFRRNLLSAARRMLFPDVDSDIEKGKLLDALRDDLDYITIHLNTPTAAGPTMMDAMGSPRDKKTVTERLVRYAQKGARFFHTPERVPYAAVRFSGHTENYRIGSVDFAEWMEQEYWNGEIDRLEQQGGTSPLTPVAGQEPLPDVVRDRDAGDAVNLLKSIAKFQGPAHEVYRRVAPHADGVYIDLCDERWRVIEVGRKGWRVIEGHEAPVRFSRTPGMLPLPEPVAGGSLKDLRDLLHLGTGAEEERNWRLIAAWLVQALSPDGAYAILTLTGAQGSAKSDTQYVLRSLVDPNIAMVRYKPKEERDLFIAASNGWTISLDNMSGVAQWLSNAICNITTLGSFGIRRNYSDDEEVLFRARRPVLLNGIGDILTYPDLLDRAAIVRLPPFESGERMTDDAVFARAGEIAPGVLGAALDCLSHYLSIKQDTPDPDLRMAAYGKVGMATEQALGWEEGTFMRAYLESRNEGNAVVLESYPVAGVLVDFLEDYTEEDYWQSPARELLDELGKSAGDLRHADEWPANASVLSRQLDMLRADLARVGVRFERKTVHGTRLINLWKNQ